MSQIASFVLLEANKLDTLRTTASPKRRFFGGNRDEYNDFLQKDGREVAHFHWAGIVIATLLSYLQERHQIDLMKSEHDDLAMFLCKERHASIFFLTNEHKRVYLNRLQALVCSEEELTDYFNTFNEANETEIGAALLDGLSSIRESLLALDERSVVLLSMG
jgi:hypothetical protein